MEIFLDCLPCFMRQVLQASRTSTEDKEIQKKILIKAAGVISEFEKYESAPEVAKEMHNIVKEYTGIIDPYKQLKQSSIRIAEKVYPFLKEFLNKQQDKLYWALKICAVGNIIDAAINYDIDIEKSVEQELGKKFKICDIDKLRPNISKDKSLLIIGDNAGETVFDRLLIESIPNNNITYAVRSEPIINDAVMEDAYASRLNEYAKIISTGCSTPGAVLDKCSKEFIEEFEKADVVVSKGQGNFEALSDSTREIFFLLKAKCSMIANRIGVDVNDYVLLSSDFNRFRKF